MMLRSTAGWVSLVFVGCTGDLGDPHVTASPPMTASDTAMDPGTSGGPVVPTSGAAEPDTGTAEPDSGAAEPDTGAADPDTGAPATTTDDSATTIAGSSSGADEDGTTGSTVDASKVVYVGRYDDSDPEHVRFGWSGSGFLFYMYGTEAYVELEDTGSNYYTILIDGQHQTDPLVTSPGTYVYPLAKNLILGHHQIDMYRRSEGAFGVTRVVGFDLGLGEMLDLELGTRRHLEIIGDGVAAGWGVYGSPVCNLTVNDQDHYVTFANRLAEGSTADTELHTVAWTGMGLVKNSDPNLSETIPQVYDRTLANEPDNAWDYARWTADVVLVNLGNSDFAGDDDPTEEAFVGAYVDFLAHVREVNPDAFILVLAPWFYGAEKTLIAGYLDSVVEQRHAAGDLEVAVENINLAFNVEDGCTQYPSDAIHKEMTFSLDDALIEHDAWPW